MDTSKIYGIALTFIPLFNNSISIKIIEKCGGLEAFFQETESGIKKLLREADYKGQIPNLKAAIENAKQENEDMEKHNISICTYKDNNYPLLLAECPDTPIAFYYKGNLMRDNSKSLAIVGTRKATHRIINKIDAVVKDLAEISPKLKIISGLAYGVDITAHKSAINHKLKTYSVMGVGLNKIYPAQHTNIANDIIKKDGVLISEFPCNSKTFPSNFLARNRIIAGLSNATLIAESQVKGGAMSTASLAFSYDRDVMTIPGFPQDEMSTGCNMLIKKGIASLVEDAKDIAKILGIRTKKGITNSPSLFSNLSVREKIIIDTIMKSNIININDMYAETLIPINEMSMTLLRMEIEGKIISLPGKNYCLPNH